MRSRYLEVTYWEGRPLAPSKATLAVLNRVLTALKQEPATGDEVAPIAA